MTTAADRIARVARAARAATVVTPAPMKRQGRSEEVRRTAWEKATRQKSERVVGPAGVYR